MKFLVCLLVTLGVAYGTILPRPNCATVFCTMDFKVCPDGTPAPVPVGGCCPSLSACQASIGPISNCATVFCTMDLKICPDGTRAGVLPGECCPSLKACKTHTIGRRSNPLGSLGSLLSGGNLLQTLGSATKGTDLGTAISILKLLNNVQQLSNDVHQIPTLINQTLSSIVNGTGQASHVVLNQLVGAVSGATQQGSGSRNLLGGNLLGGLGQNLNLLSSITHALPQGTSIAQVMSILNLLNNVNKLNNDVHQIPVLLNQTLASIVNGTGQASQVVLQQLLSLVPGQSQGTSRNLLGGNVLGGLGQNLNLLSSITHALPQGTSIAQVMSILNLLNNVNKLNKDVHQIPVLINQTLASIVNGTGQASELVLQQLLSLVPGQSQGTSRSLLGDLGQNANLLSTVSHLVPQGTSSQRFLHC